MTNQSSLAVIEDTITKVSEQFVTTLNQYKWSLIPDSQLHAAKKALTKSDYLMKIAAGSPEDVNNALIQSAILGLDLTEGKRQGWLLPRKNQAGNTVIQLQVGYKGVEAIHQRMGVIDRLVIRVARKNDEFEWSGDDQEKPKHKADWFANNEARGEITGAYAITYYPDKSINVTVSAISHIYEKHRDRSESYKSYAKKLEQKKYAFPPPWVSDEQSMIEKTMAYITAKQWPANIRDEGSASKILETLHETDISDYTYGYTQQQKEAFYSFIENDDSLGRYLFGKRVGIDVLYPLLGHLKSTFKRGTKMKLFSDHGDFAGKGEDTFHNLLKSLENEDATLLYECVDGVQPVTLKLIESNLDADNLEIYKKLTKEVE